MMKRQRGRGVIIALILLMLWQVVASMGIWSEYILPSPSRVWKALVQMSISGEVADSILISSVRVAAGTVLAFCSALLLSALNGLFPTMASWSRPMIHFLRNIPPLSMISLLILWFGIGEKSKVILIFLASFFPMFLNMEKGISGCDTRLIEVGRGFGFSRWEIFRWVRLPNAIPDIVVGVQVGLGYGWRAIVGAEMIAAASGLGYLILDAQYMARSDKVVAGILLVGLMGYLCNHLFEVLIRHTFRGEGSYVEN